jgi:BirA family biotin operon repressor/biotin-[acetyl-CoA-carboxylase] ligase
MTWLNLESVESQLRTTSIGRRVVYLTSTGSTMDVARREAEDGAGDGTVVIAEEQTSGRGRFGRAWESPAGKNLYFTVILRPRVERLRLLSMAAPLAVAKAVEGVTGHVPRIKWPNDVIMSGKKLAGVLIESEIVGDETRYALAGIGVNVNFDVSSVSGIASIATSLRDETRKHVSREALLAAILNRLEALYEGDPAVVFAAWRTKLDTIGTDVTVTLRGERFEGVAEDVDLEGNLVLRRPDGSIMTFEAGEVTLRV